MPKADGKGTVEYVKGHIVTKVPARRVAIHKVALRTDTENKNKYWAELYMKENLDPGDWYCCQVAGKQYFELKYRGDIWARGFTDIKKGRAFVNGLAKAYKITAKISPELKK